MKSSTRAEPRNLIFNHVNIEGQNEIKLKKIAKENLTKNYK
jgi:hypothetical protein